MRLLTVAYLHNYTAIIAFDLGELAVVFRITPFVHLATDVVFIQRLAFTSLQHVIQSY